MLIDAKRAVADAFQHGLDAVAGRQCRDLRPGDQHAVERDFIDLGRDAAARPFDLDAEMAGQPFAIAPGAAALALAEQHRGARLQFFRQHRDVLAGRGDFLAMGFGLMGRGRDFGGAVADRRDELRGGGDVVRHVGGGAVLFGDRAIDVVEHRADRLDRRGDAMHGIDRTGGIALQRLDLLPDFLGRFLGLHRQRFHLGRHHGKAAAGRAGARRFDGGIEREQRGLPGDLRDQIDDIADRGGRLAQAIDILAGVIGGGAGLVGEVAGLPHLGGDAFGRMGEFVGGLRKAGRGAVRGAGLSGQRVGTFADRMQRGGGRLRAVGDRIGGAL